MQAYINDEMMMYVIILPLASRENFEVTNLISTPVALEILKFLY